jgi:hypothetical protein
MAPRGGLPLWRRIANRDFLCARTKVGRAWLPRRRRISLAIVRGGRGMKDATKRPSPDCIAAATGVRSKRRTTHAPRRVAHFVTL